MTGTPGIHSGTPRRRGLAAPERSVDLLSDLLGTVHLSGAVLFRAELSEPWAIAVPDACDMAGVLPIPTEHVVPFHVVEAGSCWIEAGDGERVWLAPGEAVLVPYGVAHRLGGREETALAPVGALLPEPPWSDAPFLRHGGRGAATRIVCGFVHCEELLFNPFLRGLPVLLHGRPGADPAARWLETTIRYTAHEASSTDPGARSVLPRLTELMFVEVLRHHMRSLPAGQVGWLAAANDPILGRALGWLHRAPAQPWTVEKLARRIGVSRTVLADRFARRLGQPPMRYLARWRLQVGAQLLRTTSAPLKTIAERVGYVSEAAFGRAFKRLFGLPPADWGRQARRAMPS
jgi:AraC family transcriptional regulator, alkane utilization regulator